MHRTWALKVQGLPLVRSLMGEEWFWMSGDSMNYNRLDTSSVWQNTSPCGGVDSSSPSLWTDLPCDEHLYFICLTGQGSVFFMCHFTLNAKVHEMWCSTESHVLSFSRWSIALFDIIIIASSLLSDPQTDVNRVYFSSTRKVPWRRAKVSQSLFSFSSQCVCLILDHLLWNYWQL